MMSEPKRGLRPWLKVLLVLSLALNLAVAGIGIGAAWRFHDFRPNEDGPPMLGRFVFKDLGRHEIRRLLDDRPEDARNQRDRKHAEMVQLIALMRADTLDADALGDILDVHVSETSAFMQSVLGAWEQRVLRLNLEERHDLADRMQKQVDRGGRRGKHHDRHD